VLVVLMALAAFVLGGERRAWAASFEVSPVSLSLGGGATSGVITVTNLGTDEVRLQVTGFAWGQGPDGEIQLTPSDEITFFPALVTLKGGEARKLRVGVKAQQGPLEKTYRVMVEELPAVGGAHPGEVQVRTKMGIPVFLAPLAGAPLVRVEGVFVRKKEIAFTVRNGGTSHFVARKMTVIGHTKTGDKIFEIEKSGWYVLAGGSRNYAVDLPDKVCKLLKSIDVQIETEDGAVMKSPLTNVSCEPN
jgi:fimbrial chaperone protein